MVVCVACICLYHRHSRCCRRRQYPFTTIILIIIIIFSWFLLLLCVKIIYLCCCGLLLRFVCSQWEWRVSQNYSQVWWHTYKQRTTNENPWVQKWLFCYLCTATEYHIHIASSIILSLPLLFSWMYAQINKKMESQNDDDYYNNNLTKQIVSWVIYKTISSFWLVIFI